MVSECFPFFSHLFLSAGRSVDGRILAALSVYIPLLTVAWMPFVPSWVHVVVPVAFGLLLWLNCFYRLPFIRMSSDMLHCGVFAFVALVGLARLHEEFYTCIMCVCCSMRPPGCFLFCLLLLFLHDRSFSVPSLSLVSCDSAFVLERVHCVRLRVCSNRAFVLVPLDIRFLLCQ